MYMISIMLTQYSFILFELVYIAGVWGDIEAVSEASYLLFTQASVCLKTTVFMVNEKYLVMLLDFMESAVFDPESENHERYGNKNLTNGHADDLILLRNPPPHY